MAKLCPAGKAAAKKKFKVYPSAYANIWASKYCKGTVGRKKKADGGRITAKASDDHNYRRLAKSRINTLDKKLKKDKADRTQKRYETGNFTASDKEKRAAKKAQRTSSFIKKVKAREKTGKRSAIDTMAKGIKRREESPYNVERGMGRSSYKKGGIAKGCGRVMSNRRKTTKYF